MSVALFLTCRACATASDVGSISSASAAERNRRFREPGKLSEVQKQAAGKDGSVKGVAIDMTNAIALWPDRVSKANGDTQTVDETAPAGFSQAIADKLKKAGTEARIKVYPKGNHLAFNLGESGPEVDWTPDFLAWLRDKGLLAGTE